MKSHLDSFSLVGSPADATLIDAKWESIALAPVGDAQNPHDFFLFTAVWSRMVAHQLTTLTFVVGGQRFHHNKWDLPR